MSQEKPTKKQDEPQPQPIKYGDVFQVSGKLAGKPIAPADAAMMQAAETTMFGQTHKGGPASVMQAAATRNERAGLVGHREASDFAAKEGVTVSETDLSGTRIVTESVAGQVVGQYVETKPLPKAKVTIGEALEAAARVAGDKPVDQSDAAAITAAECRATGSNLVSPGGLAATAQSAAAFNTGLIGDQGKVKLAEILSGARKKLGADKVATREDAEGITAAELRNDPNVAVRPGGVAAAVAEAVKMNEEKGLAVK
ncbi:Seed maturation protein [Striga hermonthica]|uniref:Seed maturation protein n=1 Tax=Striga hermonthica TaxID=68872 RepID=A0A9N7NPF4_STRHE|nr:Seed maturation protein [Striga hermonthica]